jgi:hypothetical protein
MKVSVLLTAILLAVAGVASADEVKQNTQHQLSKRPYAAPVVDKETFDGAVVDKEVEKPKQLNLHMLGRRPYSEKATD